MGRAKVLVLGSNFGGLTTALAVRHELHGDVDVTVVSPGDRFLFTPSLIWLPFGKRSAADITFPVEPTLTEHGIDFVPAAAQRIDPVAKVVDTPFRRLSYDALVVATGYRNDLEAVPGVGAAAATITTLADSERAGRAWRAFVDEPGDIVIGATQRAGCFGAAYEFLFNTAHQLRKAGLKRRARITYVTAEPFVGTPGSVACRTARHCSGCSCARRTSARSPASPWTTSTPVRSVCPTGGTSRSRSP